MKIFYEKANKEILEECNQFIQNYRDSFADYYIYRKALCLYIKLSQSLLDSQKDFDDAIEKQIKLLLWMRGWKKMLQSLNLINPIIV